MNTLKKAFVILAVAAAFAACDKKQADGGEEKSAETNGAEAPTVKVVEADIPEDLQKEAESEITADNAEQAAADLEKEIEADQQ
jgi:hypothetical protein